MAEENYLIVGLGNPGKTYEGTRHNIGFRIVKALAAKYGLVFRPSLIRAKGSVAEGAIRNKETLLLLPLTYMNDSGLSVRKALDYYKVGSSHLIVVADDVALPIGKIRFRGKGSCGGHNGLRSVEAHLGTIEYPRLRIGVGEQGQEELADYVLSRFTPQEENELVDVVDRAIHGIEVWLENGAEIAMQEVNA